MGCNPCYNGYGLRLKKFINLKKVVILVIMDMAYAGMENTEETYQVVILVIMDMAYA